MPNVTEFLTSISRFDAKLLKIPFLAFTILAPTIAVLCGAPGSAAVLLITGAVCVFFIRFEDITEFEISLWKGLKAKLERSISQANATIDQLRRLGSTLSAPIVSSLALQGEFGTSETFASRQQKINEIAANLREMGVSEPDIVAALDAWRYLAGHELYRMIHRHLARLDPPKAAALKKLRPLDDDDPEHPEAVKIFIETLPKDEPDLLRLCLAFRRVVDKGELEDHSAFDIKEPELPPPPSTQLPPQRETIAGE